jgi:hypothetical protein
MKIVLAMVLFLIALGGCAGGAAPNGPQPAESADTSDSAVLQVSGQSASLLRRLAEAADGYRDGQDHFIVAAREFPHEVDTVVDSREAAEKIATARSTETLHFAAFGPVSTPPDSLVPEGPKDVDSVRVYHRDGTTKVYDADVVDALFWGLPAFDKFVAPYLAQVADAEYAGEQRRRYRQGTSRLANSRVVPHYRSSF